MSMRIPCHGFLNEIVLRDALTWQLYRLDSRCETLLDLPHKSSTEVCKSAGTFKLPFKCWDL